LPTPGSPRSTSAPLREARASSSSAAIAWTSRSRPHSTARCYARSGRQIQAGRTLSPDRSERLPVDIAHDSVPRPRGRKRNREGTMSRRRAAPTRRFAETLEVTLRRVETYVSGIFTKARSAPHRRRVPARRAGGPRVPAELTAAAVNRTARPQRTGVPGPRGPVGSNTSQPRVHAQGQPGPSAHVHPRFPPSQRSRPEPRRRRHPT
jgi:hypothetical protein